MVIVNSSEEKIIKTNRYFIDSELRPFLRIPSNTLNIDGILEARDFIISYIKHFSFKIKKYDDGLFIAYVNGKIKDNLLIYMMYDTQPINKEENWIGDPFGAEIHVLPPPLDILGDCVIARGAYNSKTPLLCFLNVVKILKEKKELPISLVLLFDAQEEIGSPSLMKFLENNKEDLKSCVDAYYPSTKQDLNGKSVLKLGYKGILSLKIKVFTNNNESHSAFSSMIPNPATDLISLLNNIYSNNKFLIECLKKPYNLTKEESSITKELLKELDVEKIKKKAGIIETIETDTKKIFIDYLFKPTFNISTLKSGYLKKGTKNMVANQALCNLDIRFAHNVSVDDLFIEIKNKVERFSNKSKSQIKLAKNLGYEGSRVKKDSILVNSLIKSADILGVSTEIWPLSAAAAPFNKIQKELMINFVVGGLGIGGLAHSPNEFIQIDSIIKNRLSIFHFLKIYSELYNKNNFNPSLSQKE